MDVEYTVKIIVRQAEASPCDLFSDVGDLTLRPGAELLSWETVNSEVLPPDADPPPEAHLSAER